MKTKEQAAKILLDAGWKLSEVNDVLKDSIEFYPQIPQYPIYPDTRRTYPYPYLNPYQPVYITSVSATTDTIRIDEPRSA